MTPIRSLSFSYLPVPYERPTLKRSNSLHAHNDFSFTPTEQIMVDTLHVAAKDHSVTIDKVDLKPMRPSGPLYLIAQHHSETGSRPTNDDLHVIFPTPSGDFFAICDGHGLLNGEKILKGEKQLGQEVAEIVGTSITTDLPNIISECNFNTKNAFERWARLVQQKIPIVFGGTTAVVGFYEKITHFFHLATVGDSEAVVFRKENGKIVPIPMSPLINWETPRYVEKVKRIYSQSDFEIWSKSLGKRRRFPLNGVNVANAFGDKCMTYNNQTAITQEPTSSMMQLKEGDLVLMACDGVFDFVTLDGLIVDVLQHYWDQPDAPLSKIIAQYALDTKNSSDNVTVLCMRVNSKMEIESIRTPPYPSTQPNTPEMEHK
jgi:serine/threonine protein phosphatase PrpC